MKEMGKGRRRNLNSASHILKRKKRRKLKINNNIEE